MFSEFFILALWKSSFGKGSPRDNLKSLPFTSSSDNHFPSFLFIFKLFRLILWNMVVKMPMVPSLHLSLTIATTGEVEYQVMQQWKKNFLRESYIGERIRLLKYFLCRCKSLLASACKAKAE